jgi:ubiquinone/menaquinone biosynthesis C-methylase UbiE
MTDPLSADVARFEKWSATYDSSRVQRFFDQVHLVMLDLLTSADHTSAPLAILDVGCGTGRLLRAAGSRWPQARLLGVDPSEGMVSQARRRLPDASIYPASAEMLPLPDACVDLVVSSFSFHHWSDQRQGLKEVTRVLTPHGRLCIADIVLPRWLAWLLGSRAKSSSALRALLVDAGLVVSHQVSVFRPLVVVSLGGLVCRRLTTTGSASPQR